MVYNLEFKEDKKNKSYSVNLFINDYHYHKVFKDKQEAESLYSVLLHIQRELTKQLNKSEVYDCVKEVREELNKK